MAGLAAYEPEREHRHATDELPPPMMQPNPYLEEGKGLADSRSTDSGEQRLSQESEESRAQ